MITDAQILTIVLAAVPPTLAVMIGILMNNARISDFKHYMDHRFNDMNDRFDRRFIDIDRRFDETDQRASELRVEMNRRFDGVDRRFDEVKDIWRSELRRVEEILDARLKHLEEG